MEKFDNTSNKEQSKFEKKILLINSRRKDG